MELKQFVKEAGGVLIAAHPFRNNFTYSSPDTRLAIDTACQSKVLQLVDAMEVINGWATEEDVVFCQKVSRELGLNGTGGSDAHVPWQIGCCVTVFENNIKSEAELVAELKRGNFRAEDRRYPEQKNPFNWFH